MLHYTGQFEVHLTARTDDAAADAFRQWCDTCGFKCVRIVLSRGQSQEQPMATWRRDHTDLPAVLAEASEYAQSARDAGHQIVRVKVETPLTNQDVPITDAQAGDRDASLYFEHHLKIRRRSSDPIDQLQSVSEQHGAHLSRNAFAKADGDHEHRFVTLRSYGVGAETSNQQVRQLLDSLDDMDAEVVECESEYCVYDSNIALDAGWLSSNQPIS